MAPRARCPALDWITSQVQAWLSEKQLRAWLRKQLEPAAALYRLAQFAFFRRWFRDRGSAFDALVPSQLLNHKLPQHDATVAFITPSIDPAEQYQELLSYQPSLDLRRRSFDLVRVIGSQRKTSGSYYTPPSLIDCLLRSALDPLIDEAKTTANPEAALLRLRICDPACGAGHFLIAAAQRIAESLANYTGTIAAALSKVIANCVFGVDLDPIAVLLCRLSLHSHCENTNALIQNIRCGNSLVELNQSGLDVVLCNPPWERVKFQEKEWLASHGTADESVLKRHRRQSAELSQFLRRSGRFPLSARGDLNYYGPFIELSRQLIRRGGRVGLIVPSGLATDDSMKELFQSILNTDLVSWYDFHNRSGLFPGVQGNIKFGLLTLGERKASFEMAAQLSDPTELNEQGRVCNLTPEQIRRLNPNTLHCPSFTSAADAELVQLIHRRFDVLMGDPDSNPWNIRPWTMFHMTKDAPFFRRQEELLAEGWTLTGNVFVKGDQRLLPLYEAKLIGQFSDRGATFAGVAPEVRFRMHARTNPLTSLDEPVLPRYWVPEDEVRRRAGDARWFLGFRNAISAVADARSLIAAIVPRAGVGNSLPLIDVPDARSACLLLALLNSFVVDYVLRQKASGGNLNFHVLKQLPVPAPELFARPCPWSMKETLADWIIKRVVALVCTTNEVTGFATECNATPHRALPEQLRAELDAAVFYLFGLATEQSLRILRSFTILERRERFRHGTYASADRILAVMSGRV